MTIDDVRRLTTYAHAQLVKSRYAAMQGKRVAIDAALTQTLERGTAEGIRRRAAAAFPELKFAKQSR